MCVGKPIGLGLTFCTSCKKIYYPNGTDEERQAFKTCTCDGVKLRYVGKDNYEEVHV